MANTGFDTTLRFEWRSDGKQGKNVPIRHDELPNTGVPRPFVYKAPSRKKIGDFMEQRNAKTIEGALPKSVGGTGAGNWNIDGDSYQFVPGKMENCDLVKFDDAGVKVEKGQGGFSDQSGDHGTQGKG